MTRNNLDEILHNRSRTLNLFPRLSASTRSTVTNISKFKPGLPDFYSRSCLQLTTNQASIDSDTAVPHGASNLVSSHATSRKLEGHLPHSLAADAFDDTDDIASIRPGPASDHPTHVTLKRTLSHSMALGDCSRPSKRLKINVAAGNEYISSIDLVDDGSVQLYNESELPDPEHYDHAIVKSFAENVTHMQDFEDLATLRKINRGPHMCHSEPSRNFRMFGKTVVLCNVPFVTSRRHPPRAVNHALPLDPQI
ncbi:hypothetical protein PILCRDRAFT_288842 [Piloderma croceum F 1598]|uniref:Uncharacterized protein n=1 Tax=Piloderma croceum (strain F 1598) TaxID=765440 RepID=A0A0C3GAM9_PILCF|nr:hypothetical protein PILCRDRAFT_288842 [Piloderma croceum F 1598]